MESNENGTTHIWGGADIFVQHLWIGLGLPNRDGKHVAELSLVKEVEHEKH